jgi:choline dehydrogenase-like flavoprotein
MLFPPLSHYSSDATLFTDAQASARIEHHYTGTCQMGTDISNGVVDGNLKVFGVQNLMVADSSVAPFPETGNVAFQAYVIGIMTAKILYSFVINHFFNFKS